MFSVSVVMSTYNGSKWISEQLESIKSQTRIPNEVIIADDCSIDDTVSIIKNYIKVNELENWSLLENSRNLGWKRNFYEVLKKADGDYIFLADQDDIWDDNKIYEMAVILEKNPKIQLLASSYVQFDEKNIVPLSKNIRKTIKYDGSVRKLEFNEKFMYVLRPGCTYAFRKELFFDLIEGWETKVPHDANLWRMAIIRDGLYLYDKSLVKWRRHEDSSSSMKTLSGGVSNPLYQRYQFKIEKTIEDINYLRSINDIKVNDHHKEQIIKKSMNHYLSMLKGFTSKALLIMLKEAVLYHKYYYAISIPIFDCVLLLFIKIGSYNE